MALDKIHIREIDARCIVGIRDWERKKVQEVKISLTLHLDLSRACRSDRIEDTVDYKNIKDAILKRVENTRYDLIERMAQDVADIALEDQRVERAEVTVDKLLALRFARSVAVEDLQEQSLTDENRCWVDAYVAVGSNIDPAGNIAKGARMLGRYEQVRLTGTSPFYISSPLERPEQPDFLNGVWSLRTTLTPGVLKQKVLRDVERRLGRVRSEDTHAARELDLDILLFGHMVLDELRDGVRVPAADLHRPFVAAPLFDLAGDMEIPDWNKTTRELYVAADRDTLSLDVELTSELQRIIEDGQQES